MIAEALGDLASSFHAERRRGWAGETAAFLVRAYRVR